MKAGRIAAVAGALSLLLALFAAGADARLPPLHATQGSSPAIVDSAGNQVLLHGVAVNQLGDYYRVKPGRPPVFPLHRSDFVQMRRLGFDVARLVVSWSKLEPRRGQFSTAYLAKVHRAVRWASSEGIYVILDMHQDAWGKEVATAPGEVCAPGFAPSIGWDGAPAWATRFDGMSRCHAQVREVSPAVAAAFDNLYADTDGIQAEFDRAWARLAREFATNPGVAGFDLFNEPHPGTKQGPAAQAEIGALYDGAIAAIRRAEGRARGGLRHIVFFEPSVLYDITVAPTDSPLPGFTDDDDLVFSPHLYPGTFSPLSSDDSFAAANSLRAAYRAPMFIGEWGFYSDAPRTDYTKIADFAADEDSVLAGDSWWLWRERCGDPHTFGEPDSKGASIANGLNRYRCPGDHPTGIPLGTRRVLGRPYVRSAPGRILTMKSDPSTAVISMSAETGARARDCGLRVWTPKGVLPGTPGFDSHNVRHLRTTRRHGGWMTTGCPHGDYSVRTSFALAAAPRPDAAPGARPGPSVPGFYNPRPGESPPRARSSAG